MFCKHCDKEYQRMSGVLRFKKDYGFCSVRCVTDSKEPCPSCGKPIVHHDGERLAEFVRRRFCSRKCASTYTYSQPKSEETRKRMSESARHRSPEHLAKIVESRRRFYATEEGKQSRKEQDRRHSEWLQSNSEAVVEMRRKQSATRKAHGEENSAQQRAFYQTPAGEALKEKYRRLYTGKKRPPRVAQKVKDAVCQYWDSPEGQERSRQLSLQMGEGERFAPFGPGWPRKASKIRQRDGHTCIICGATKEAHNRALDVHHIYSRGMFGYIPGKNSNYLWSDHPANLITLCKACHVKVRVGLIDIPLEYQECADSLWQIFTESC